MPTTEETTPAAPMADDAASSAAPDSTASRASGPLLAWQRVRAIAGLTVGEALRSRFLLAVVVLGVIALLYASQADAIADVDRAKVLRESILGVINGVTIVATLFLCAFALPADVESRRIYTIVTKPVGRGLIVVGRFVGFFVLVALLIGILGALGYGLLAMQLSDADRAEIAPRASIEPSNMTSWGEAEMGEEGSADDPFLRDLRNPYNAGVRATFTGLSRNNFDEDGVLAELQVRLRLREGRLVRGRETAMLTAEPLRSMAGEEATAASREANTARITVPLEADRPSRFRLPWSAFSQDPATNQWQSEVSLIVEHSPYVLRLEPGSLVLLSAPRPEWQPYLAALLTLLLQVAFVLVVALSLSTLVTPYTAILAGLFAVVAANMVGSLDEGVAKFERQLTFAKMREQQGVPMDASMQFAETLLGDPRDEYSRWRLLLVFADVFPAFDQQRVQSTYVDGYVPDLRSIAAQSGFLVIWIGALLSIGVVCFTFRDFP